MFLKIRRRYGLGGEVAVLAVIAALVFAGVPAVAQPIANTSASVFNLAKRALGLSKKANKRAVIANKRSINAIKIARSAQGQLGPQGPKGDTGDTGPRGSAGDDGAKGKPGAGVVTTALVPGEGGCAEGGTEFEVEGTGESDTVCNGEDGQSGFTASLPSEQTETGTWALGTISSSAIPGGNPLYVPVSLPIPLGGELDGTGCDEVISEAVGPECELHYINSSGEEVVFTGAAVEEVEPQDCGVGLTPEGNAQEPRANPGHLCVYAGFEANMGPFGSPAVGLYDPTVGAPTRGSTVAGSMLGFAFVEANARAGGSWAVTAP